MKRWKGSLGAKIGAWIGITISGVVFLGSIVGAIVIQEAGMYDYEEEEFRKEAYESVAAHYSIRALDNMENQGEKKWNDTNFRYGIVKAENIDDIDWNDESIYVERNFSYEVTEDDLYLRKYEIGENTQFDYSSTLWGGYSITDSYPAQKTNDWVYNFCYNKTDGIFYYEAENEFYPVRSVKLVRNTAKGSEIYALSYDFERGMYRNLGKQAAETVAEETQETGNSSSAEFAENTAATYYIPDVADELLGQEYLTMNLFDDTDFSWNQWTDISFDETAYSNFASNVLVIDGGYMSSKPVTEERNYRLSEDFARLEISPADNGADAKETYWVAVILPENVRFGWSKDLFVQANTLITLGYALRYSIYGILFGSLGLCIFFFVYLIAAAGHRKGQEEIVLTALDKIPFDLYLCAAGFVEIVLMMVLVNISYWSTVPGMVWLGSLLLGMCWLALLTTLTFAVRVKHGKWWRNTIIWHIFRWIGSIFRMLQENVSLLWKAILAMGALAFFEFMGILILLDYATGKFLFVWFLEKIALAVLVCGAIVQMSRLQEGSRRIAEGDLAHQIDTEKMFFEFKKHGENLNSISSGMSKAVDERMKSERFKTELITNVSHDIKTPLTSIINYVDLLEKEELQNESAEEYLEVLDRQSGRLKKLIEDLMEASKASTGNLTVNLEKLEAGVSLVQTVGEFEEKMHASELELLIQKPQEPVYIMADSRHFWRVIDNLMNNICKYAQPGTRVYINLEQRDGQALLTFRNTSRYPLNISSEELMERFVRGDSSRNTEGSGLGLSIAKSLMELMEGTFELYVDGDLFKVVLKFPIV